MAYWTLKKNSLGDKRAQDKSQKRGKGLGINAQRGTNLGEEERTKPAAPLGELCQRREGS